MRLAPDRARKPAVKWHGSKWRLASWILEFMPEVHKHDVYVENFGGNAAVLLQKPRSRIEVYNDKDLEIYNFFWCLRNFEHMLIDAIKKTPYHVEEWEAYIKDWSELDKTAIGENWLPIEKARRFYAYAQMSIMGPSVSWTNGFRRQKQLRTKGRALTPAAQTFSQTEHLHIISSRLKGVVFEKQDAMQLACLYDDPATLFYMDPPYLETTRSRLEPAYKHEMASRESHLQFLDTARRLQGMVLISSYESDLYNEQLILKPDKSWISISKKARVNGPNTRQEILYLNPQLQEALNG